MKVIIAGSRGITNYQLVKEAVAESGFDITEIVSGGARGVDRLGEQLAKELGVPVTKFIPDWSIGKQAGVLRNTSMAKYADALIAVWDGRSTGTLDMMTKAYMRNLKSYVKRVNKDQT